MFGGGINGAQLKSQLKMCMSRLQTETNQKRALMKQNMQEIAMLLNEKPPKEEKAKLRAVALIHDDNIVEAYDFLKLECELLAERTRLVQNSKECPTELVSCVSDVIYAAPRVEISELAAIRKQFRAKYGKQFEENAHNNNGGVVSERIVNKLALYPPPPYLVQTYLMKIAKLYNVAWVPTVLIPEEEDFELVEVPAIPVTCGVEVVPTKKDEASGGAITGVEVYEYEKGPSKTNYDDGPVAVATLYSPQADGRAMVAPTAPVPTAPIQDDSEITDEGYLRNKEGGFVAYNQSEGDQKIPGEGNAVVPPTAPTASSSVAQPPAPMQDDSEANKEEESRIASYNQNEGDRKIPGIAHANASKSNWDDIPDDEINEMIGLDDAASSARHEATTEKEGESAEKSGDWDSKFKEVVESPKRLSKSPHENGDGPVVATRNLPASDRDQQMRESEPSFAVGGAVHSSDEIMDQYEEAMNELQAELEKLPTLVADEGKMNKMETNKTVPDDSVAESTVAIELDNTMEDQSRSFVPEPVKDSAEGLNRDNVGSVSVDSLVDSAEDPGEISADKPGVVNAIVANQVSADITNVEEEEPMDGRAEGTVEDPIKDSAEDSNRDHVEDPKEDAAGDPLEGPSDRAVDPAETTAENTPKDSSGSSAKSIEMNHACGPSDIRDDMPDRVDDGHIEIPRVSSKNSGINGLHNNSAAVRDDINGSTSDFPGTKDNLEGSSTRSPEPPQKNSQTNEQEDNIHPDDSSSNNNDAEITDKFAAKKNKKATPGQIKGAAIVGGVAGFLVGGPVGTVVGAAGAAHLATSKKGKLAKMARGAGKRVNNTFRYVFEED